MTQPASAAGDAPKPEEDSATEEPRDLHDETAPPELSSAQPRFRNIYEEIDELTKTRMTEALTVSGGARAKAAELIGMPLRTFVTKLKTLGVDVPRGRAPRGKKSDEP